MKKISKTLLASLLLVLLSSFYLQAQEEPAPAFTAKNALYLEVGANAIYYSINYERIFYQQANFKMAARAGVSAIPINIANKNYGGYILPLEIVGLLGKSKHHLEVGTGITPYWMPHQIRGFEEEFDSYKFNAIIPIRIGYRYQKPEGGFFFRAGYTPFYSLEEGMIRPFILLFGGVSVGKSF